MKSVQQHTPRHILLSLTLTLALLLSAPGVTPAATAGQAPTVRGMTSAGRPAPETAGPAGLAAGDWATMQDLMAAAQYQFTWQTRDGEWAYRAPNRAHNLALAFAPDGFAAARYDVAGELLWEFGLALRAYGERAFPVALNAADLDAHRARVTYRWGEWLTEGYENQPQGIEHRLTLHAPPQTGQATLTFALRGDLSPDLDEAGQVLRLRDARGGTALLYDGLRVTDAAGRALPAHMELVRNPRFAVRIVVDDSTATYPLGAALLLHSELGILRPMDSQEGDFFGYSVAISGDTIVVGANGENGGPGDPKNSAGAAYVFARNKGGADDWGEAQILRASDAEKGDQFGVSVAISGDTVVVGTPVESGGPGDPAPYCGAAYVFARNDGGADNWGEVTKLSASPPQDGAFFGWSVAISGDTVVVGAHSEDAGAAYVFARNHGGADNWGQVSKLTASDGESGDGFGYSVAVSDDTVVVGAGGEDGGPGNPVDRAGAVYVFARNQGGADNWGYVTKLTSSDPQEGGSFGGSAAIRGDTIVVGAGGEDGGPGDPLDLSGAAYVFTRNQGGADKWEQVAALRPLDRQEGDGFGRSAAISGDTVVVGASREDGGIGDPAPDAGAAYVFSRNHGGADNWGQVAALRASDGQADDRFGDSVAISGDTVVAGAPLEYGGGGDPAPGAGAAYVFSLGGGKWEETAIPRASDGQAEDWFGYSVAMSGDTVVVGAWGEDGEGGSPALDAGAAYVFTRNQGGADKWGGPIILRASDSQQGDYFGRSVASSGDTVVVGAYGEDGGTGDPVLVSGAAYVFARNRGGADNWGQVQVLRASDRQMLDYFGFSVAISGDTVVVGAWGEDGGVGNPRDGAGAAYIFARNHGGADYWGEVTILHASDAADDDHFGRSVAISGGTVVVGADGEDGETGHPASNAGAAYVFGHNQGGADYWGEVMILRPIESEVDDFFGYSVAVSGDTVVVGAYGEDGGPGGPAVDAGAAYLFARNQGGADYWGEVTVLRASDKGAEDYFGRAVSISGDTVVVGAYGEDGGTGDPLSDAGAAYIFARNQGGPDSWGEVTVLRASDSQAGDYFGRSVAISGDTIVVGADGEDGETGQLASNAGAAYVFTLRPFQVYLPLTVRQ